MTGVGLRSRTEAPPDAEPLNVALEPGRAEPRPDRPSARRRHTSLAHFAPAVRIVLLYALTMFMVVVVVFALPRLMPGDPIQAREDPASSLFVSNPEALAHLRAYYGLDQPPLQQFGAYVARIVRGDLGYSIAQNIPVATMIRNRLPWTALLMGTALIISTVIAFVAGISSAWWRGRKRDRALVTMMTGVRAVPEYALASVLLIVFAVALPVLPLSGGSTAFADYGSWWGAITDIARHLVLPAGTLTLALLGARFLLLRNTTVTVLGEDFMLLAKAKGLPTRLLKYRHAGRNAMLPFLTVLGIEIGFAVGGAIFVETVFNYPGMGSMILAAVTARDYPVLEGAFLTLAAAVLLANFIIELVYRRLDPRVGART